MEFGRDRFLTKPFSPKKLYARAADSAGLDSRRSETPNTANETPWIVVARRRRWIAVLAAEHAHAPQNSLLPARLGVSPLLRRAVERLRSLAPAEQILILTNGAVGAADSPAFCPDIPAGESGGASPRRGHGAAASLGRRRRSRGRDGPRRRDDLDPRRLGDRRPSGLSGRRCEARGFRSRRNNGAGHGGRRARRARIPGFGYIHTGVRNRARHAPRARFVEKPDPHARAEQMRPDGYLWNSGIFRVVRGRFSRRRPASSRRRSRRPLHAHAQDIQRPFSRAITPYPVDVGVLERQQPVVVFRAISGGTTSAQWGRTQARAGATDKHGNAAKRQDCTPWTRGTTSCTPRARRVLYGVSDTRGGGA
jgi:hypothetical protein